MKGVCFVFLSITLLSGDSLLTYNKSNDTYSYCVSDYYYSTNNRLYFKKSNSSNYNSINLGQNYKSYSFKDGYEYKNGICQLKNDLKISSMTSEQYTLLMIILANFAGLAIVLPFSSLITRS